MGSGLLLLAFQLQSDPSAFFEEKIRPLLAARCIGCHGDAKVSGLRLDSRDGMLLGGRRGPALVPGDPGRTLILQAVTQTHEVLKMPPGGKLQEPEVEALRAWVAIGAPWPEAKLVSKTGKITKENRDWWAFRPLQAFHIAYPNRTIDGMILEKMKEARVQPAPGADRRTLIRRLHFDFTGLPPTPERVEEFVRDGNVPKLVDELLASPHFGERWGRFWLDVARYGEDDVLGLSQQNYANAWRYRDWVVEAFNRDLPYDVFVKAQVAADQMEGDWSFDLRPALGFFGLGPWQYTVSPPPQARADERHDKIDTVTRGFLGLTVACARCHDHKFDPITTRDYYGLAGVFGSTEYQEYPLVDRVQVEKFEQHQAEVRAKEKQIKDFLDTQRQQLGEILAAQTADYLRAAKGEPVDALYPMILDRWRTYLAKPTKDHPFFSRSWSPDSIADLVRVTIAEKKEVDEEKRQAVERTKPKKGAAKTRLPNGFETYDEFCPGCDVAVRSMNRDRYVFYQSLFQEPGKETPGGIYHLADKELEPFLSGEWRNHLERLRKQLADQKKSAPAEYAYLHGVADKRAPANLRIALRGDPYSLGEETPRRFLEVLCDGEPELWTEGSGRLQLAESIARHPLAARVMANRIWMWLMGRGIVTSASNFGRYGDRPTHPELLEYLAWRFQRYKWSIKKLIREIVLTETYQRSSVTVEASEAADGGNKLYWRSNRKRLDAEALRDAMLATGGTLDTKVGGASQELGPESRRRTIYGRVSRFQLNETLQLFDFPNPSITSEKRVVTHVPLQRLYFLNNDFVLRQAKALADRVKAESSEDARIVRAYALLYGRGPKPQELTLGREFLRDGEWTQYAQTLLSSNEFLFVD